MVKGGGVKCLLIHSQRGVTYHTHHLFAYNYLNLINILPFSKVINATTVAHYLTDKDRQLEIDLFSLKSRS